MAGPLSMAAQRNAAYTAAVAVLLLLTVVKWGVRGSEEGPQAKLHAMFLDGETSVARYRQSRDQWGRGDLQYLEEALVLFDSLEQHDSFDVVSEDERALLWDSFDYCYRTLRRDDEAAVYEHKLAVSEACQMDADGCFPSVVSRLVVRMRRENSQKATDFFNGAIAQQGADGTPLLDWVDPLQLPAW